MFLKRLEIIGFKSFAERIAVDFVPGVTAIVGPNGSGKSNITDAIRWVLGEQSAKSLRGSKMEDIIFAGSTSRKALNFAEVTLVLDNSSQALQTAYEEVSVTRRVYRSGDSEYLLNRQSCRLKDITELFMDSGLGREAFSIISQGKVDEILNSKAEDRRAIFEETAGVLKYKQRKKKAEFKLLETDDNLNRVLDILHELEGRIEPLQIQASIARDYLDFAEELKNREVNLAVFDIERNTQLLSELSEKKSVLTTELNEITGEKEKVVSALQKDRAALDELEIDLDRLQDEAVTYTTDLERQEGRKLVLQEKENNAHLQTEKLIQAIQTAEQEIEELIRKKTQYDQQLSEKVEKVKVQQKERKRIEHLLSSSSDEVELQIEQRKADYIDLLNEEAALKNEQRLLESQAEKQQFQLKRVTEEGRTLEDELTQAVGKETELASQKKKADELVEQALSQYQVVKQQLDQATMTFEKQQQALYDGYQHLHKLRAKRDSLEDLESEFSGYFQGVKELLKRRAQGADNGVEGAVADLLTIPNDFVVAIETAIGGQAQHLVMQDNRSAQQAIAFLKQKQLGRATFLPLDTMKPRALPVSVRHQIEQHDSYIAPANELVQTEEQYESIRDYLLGHIIVAKDLKGASELAKLIRHSHRIVTLEGDVVNPGGSLSGGANKKQSSVFSRKSELAQLHSTVRKLEQELKRAEKSVAAKKQDKNDLASQLEILRENGEQLRQDQQQIVANLSAATSYADRLRDRQKSYSLQVQEQDGDQLVAKQRLEEIAKLLSRYKAQSQELQNQIDELTTLKHQSVKQRDTLQNQLGELHTELAVGKEQLQQLERDAEHVEDTKQKALKQVEQWNEELNWYKSDSSSYSAEQLDQEIKRLTTLKFECTELIRQKREGRQQIQQSIRSLELKESSISEKYHSLALDIEKLQLQVVKVEEGITSRYELLEDDYEISFEIAKEQYSEPEDSEKERTKIRLLKKSIDELGPVNVSAIEEFEQVQERYEFLTEQREDLLAAKETLHDAISEMDVEMTERFSATFFKIQQHFREVFRKLFGGGQADLVLTDPENMLETGVEIVAQPPGKKLQNLSLLSGGERALTAIALLFAILQTRPVPFCILDEVEAALDEANVVRYSNYLQQFSGETQFIVITHRKGTMEGADVLYGVTMQESGVSKLVSVKLEEYV